MKLQEIWRLTDEPTGLQIVALYRQQLELLEHSTSIVEQGYFITPEQVEQLLRQGFEAGWLEGNGLRHNGQPFEDIIKDAADDYIASLKEKVNGL